MMMAKNPPFTMIKFWWLHFFQFNHDIIIVYIIAAASILNVTNDGFVFWIMVTDTQKKLESVYQLFTFIHNDKDDGHHHHHYEWINLVKRIIMMMEIQIEKEEESNQDLLIFLILSAKYIWVYFDQFFSI